MRSAAPGDIDTVIKTTVLAYSDWEKITLPGETVAADGKYMAVGCKFSKDRFLPVGPLHAETEQLVDISGEKMVLVADHPVRPEPHDFIIFKRELLQPVIEAFAGAVKP